MTRSAALAAVLLSAPVLAQPIPDYGFDWVTIGDVGNLGYDGADPFGTGVTGRGSVDYEYRIGRMEVSTDQWLEFVNTFSTQSDDLRLFGAPTYWGAVIDRDYDGPGRRWELSSTPDADRFGVYGITWYDAARFANWLHNGKGSSLDTLVTGAYDTTTWGVDTDGNRTDAPSHLPDARFWIPTLDEWLKAVHYDPNKGGDGVPGWWLHPHASDVPTIPGVPGVGESSAGLPIVQNPYPGAIPLGSYTDVQSPWGLLDTSGGAAEWVEDYFVPDPGDLPPDPPTDRIFAGAEAGHADLWSFFERLDTYSTSRPDNGLAGLRLASRVPPPMSVQVLALAWMGSVRRRRTISSRILSGSGSPSRF